MSISTTDLDKIKCGQIFIQSNDKFTLLCVFCQNDCFALGLAGFVAHIHDHYPLTSTNIKIEESIGINESVDAIPEALDDLQENSSDDYANAYRILHSPSNIKSEDSVSIDGCCNDNFDLPDLANAFKEAPTPKENVADRLADASADIEHDGDRLPDDDPPQRHHGRPLFDNMNQFQTPQPFGSLLMTPDFRNQNTSDTAKPVPVTIASEIQTPVTPTTPNLRTTLTTAKTKRLNPFSQHPRFAENTARPRWQWPQVRPKFYVATIFSPGGGPRAGPIFQQPAAVNPMGFPSPMMMQGGRGGGRGSPYFRQQEPRGMANNQRPMFRNNFRGIWW